MSSLIMPRRAFIGGLIGLVAAPMVAKSSMLMPVKGFVDSPYSEPMFEVKQTFISQWLDDGQGRRAKFRVVTSRVDESTLEEWRKNYWSDLGHAAQSGERLLSVDYRVIEGPRMPENSRLPESGTMLYSCPSDLIKLENMSSTIEVQS